MDSYIVEISDKGIKVWFNKEEILEKIKIEYENMKDILGSKAMNKIEKRVFPILPDNNDESIELFDYLVSSDD